MPRTPRRFTTEPLDLPSSHPHKVQTNRSLPCNFAHDFPVLGFRQLSHALAAAVYSRQYKASNHHHSPAKNRSAALLRLWQEGALHNNNFTCHAYTKDHVVFTQQTRSGMIQQTSTHLPRQIERSQRPLLFPSQHRQHAKVG